MPPRSIAIRRAISCFRAFPPARQPVEMTEDLYPIQVMEPLSEAELDEIEMFLLSEATPYLDWLIAEKNGLTCGTEVAKYCA